MEEQRNIPSRQGAPRRRKPTQMEIFKEKYLPLVVLAIVAVLLIFVIAGSITRAVQRRNMAIEASVAAAQEEARIRGEAQSITETAAVMAAEYNYEGAIALIKSFSGDMADFPILSSLLAEYQSADSMLVSWNDPNVIPNLSFQMLVADPVRAFSNEEYGNSIKKNYILTTEFSKILEQLYANGYVLVYPEDFVTTKNDENGNMIYTAAPIRLPAGKIPFVLTQTNVNYDLYLVDGNDDGYADKDGCGFANKLVLQDDGSFAAEYYDASGQLLTGDYDLIPILDKFIDAHPDFSYRGARAVIALTGEEGLFGYRTSAQHKAIYGDALYNQEVADAKALAQALTDKGYKLACYTYSNTTYGTKSAAEIQEELDLWKTEVTPIIGPVDTIAFAQKSDITEGLIYMGDKHAVLQDAGFVYYLGFCSDGEPWTIVVDDYIRQGRILVGGSALKSNSEWFEEMFDPSAVLDSEAR